jgi:hypothetical protein
VYRYRKHLSLSVPQHPPETYSISCWSFQITDQKSILQANLLVVRYPPEASYIVRFLHCLKDNIQSTVNEEIPFPFQFHSSSTAGIRQDFQSRFLQISTFSTYGHFPTSGHFCPSGQNNTSGYFCTSGHFPTSGHFKLARRRDNI